MNWTRYRALIVVSWIVTWECAWTEANPQVEKILSQAKWGVHKVYIGQCWLIMHWRFCSSVSFVKVRLVVALLYIIYTLSIQYKVRIKSTDLSMSSPFGSCQVGRVPWKLEYPLPTVSSFGSSWYYFSFSFWPDRSSYSEVDSNNLQCTCMPMHVCLYP